MSSKSITKPNLPLSTKKPNNPTPAAPVQTEKLVVFLTKELTDKIDEKAKDMFGQRKGNVSLYLEQALRIHLHMTLDGVHER